MRSIAGSAKLPLVAFTFLVNTPGMCAAAGIEEITVTAQRKSEPVQDVPISIAVFGASELERSGIGSTDDIGTLTPNLQMGRQSASVIPFMRGVGAQAGTGGVESAVGFYLDDVYQHGAIDNAIVFNNVERVEVLKGPQGTLFGRNTTGGVINVITRDPSHEPQLEVGVTGENYKALATELYGSIGVSDNLAADLAVVTRTQNDYYGKNLFDNSGVGYNEYTSVRSKLLITPTDATTVRLTFRYSEVESDLGMAKDCLEGSRCVGGRSAQGDFHDIDASHKSYVEGRTWATSAKIEHSFGDIDLVSITGYKDNRTTQYLDQDGTRIPGIFAIFEQSVVNYSQELQLLSDASDVYEWIVGLYYFNDKTQYDPLQLTGALVPVPRTRIYSHLDTESIAAFFQNTYHFNRKTSVTAGLRWTKDERENYGHADFTLFGTRFSDDASWEEPTWRLVLDHHLRDDVLLYASYDRGFKSGIFNALNTRGTTEKPIDPEKMDAFEVGVKGDYFDGRLRVNASTFLYKYEDIQLQRVVGGGATLLNAAEDDIKGVELDGQAVVTDNLSLRFGASYLDATYESFPDCVITTPTTALLGGGNVLTQGDCGGNYMIRAPKWTYNLSANYELESTVGTWGAGVTAAYNDGFYWEPDNRVKQSSYTLVNAELSWSSPDQKYKVTLFGKNLLDEEYSLYLTESALGDSEAAAAPLTYGIAFNIKLGSSGK